MKGIFTYAENLVKAYACVYFHQEYDKSWIKNIMPTQAEIEPTMVLNGEAGDRPIEDSVKMPTEEERAITLCDVFEGLGKTAFYGIYDLLPDSGKKIYNDALSILTTDPKYKETEFQTDNKV